MIKIAKNAMGQVQWPKDSIPEQSPVHNAIPKQDIARNAMELGLVLLKIQIAWDGMDVRVRNLKEIVVLNLVVMSKSEGKKI